MNTLSSALDEIFQASPELQFGFLNGLFNLTQLAKFIRPMAEARTKKEVKETTIVMALSRRARAAAKAKRLANLPRYKVEHISVLSGLTVMTIYRTDENHRATEAVYSKLKRIGSYLTLSEGSSEITAIFESKHRQLVSGLLPQKPKLVRDQVASLSVRFHPKYIEVPGLLHKILEQISLQGINIIELASTATELILYIREDDIRLAFDTILKGFVEEPSL